MFHTCPVNMRSTAARSRPTLLCGNAAASASTSPGMKPRIGMLCRMSSIGISSRSAGDPAGRDDQPDHARDDEEVDQAQPPRTVEERDRLAPHPFEHVERHA